MEKRVEIIAGQVVPVSRRITHEDIASAVELTQDRGRWHVDEQLARQSGFRGIIAPGLLTASIVTEFGGSIDFLAVTMFFEFLAPVYAGDLVEGAVTVETFDPETRRLTANFELSCSGKTVMRGRTEGFQGGPPSARKKAK